MLKKCISKPLTAIQPSESIFRALPYHKGVRAEWDALIRESVNGALILFRDYIEYHQDRFAEKSLLIVRGDQVVAAFPAEAEWSAVHSYRGLTFAGPIFHETLDPKWYVTVVRLIVQYYRAEGFSRIFICPMPCLFWKNAGLEAFEHALQDLGGKITTSLLFDAVTLPFVVKDQARRWGRRKALSAGLTVVRDASVDAFWDEVLIPHLQSRHQTSPVHSKDEIRLLRSKFPNLIQLWAVQQSGKLLAGSVLYLHGRVVHCQYIASTAEGRSVRALDLLFSTVLETFGNDQKFLSLGTSVNPKTGLRDPGLVRWKESWGAEAYPMPRWSLTVQTD
jgi:hypothetical protein